MKEIYAWVPWFQELTKKIADGGEGYLIDRAKHVEWGDNPALLQFGDENIDPFSFLYFLASKNTRNQRVPVYQSVNAVFDIKGGELIFSEKYRDEKVIFPTPTPHTKHLFLTKTSSNPALLWKLFRQAVRGVQAVQEDTFKSVLQMPNVHVAKLTQSLFLINPSVFMPVDSRIFKSIAVLGLPTYSEAMRAISGHGGLTVYQSLTKQLQSIFLDCEIYEINTAIFWLENLRELDIPVGADYFQVSANVDGDGENHWSTFDRENCVYTGGAGKTRAYPLGDVAPGDIVLARFGYTRGKGIGVVYKNEYADGGWSPEKVIHVVWMNKRQFDLDGQTDQLGFNAAKRDSKTFALFQNVAGYAKVIQFIENFSGGATPPKPEDNGPSPQARAFEMPQPLNQIFFGPPGTGKTYRTVQTALEIIHGANYPAHKARKELKSEFDRLKARGQIGIVTFHQSFGYEEFVEGIRPKMSGDQSAVTYGVEDGIFKKMCVAAAPDESLANFEKAMTSLKEECEEESITVRSVRNRVKYTVSLMEDGDAFLMHREDRDPEKSAPLYIDSIRKLFVENPNRRGFPRMKAILKYLKQRHGLGDSSPPAEQADNDHIRYVLIIDEINRGNVSRIFGELITLIEPSKRVGNDEATTVSLPYSGETFGVPKNLYIIGTMNTADRSIALLDTALRRRFRFVEMMPDLTLLEECKVGDIDVKRILETMNNRIESLYDRDHQIGHSFFLPLKDVPEKEKLGMLADIFEHEILPLLQEYFYDDWEKIDLVLNKNGFLAGKDPEKLEGVPDGKRIWWVETRALNERERYRAIYGARKTGEGESDGG